MSDGICVRLYSQEALAECDDAVLDRIEALLSPTPIGRDELARAAGLSIAETAAALLELHLTGRATLLPGGLAST